jgi:hypothetical protein
MKLKSFGCSFIFGSELADDGRDLPTPTPSNFTWPAHVARHLNYKYECRARPGAGNLQIAERILTHLVDAANEFFVIGWTWIDRFDYTNTMINSHPQAAQWGNWRTLMPIDNTPTAQMYYRDLHTEYRDKLTTLMSMRLVIDTLKQKDIPFIMTYMDDLTFDQRWNTTPAVIELQEYVQPYMICFDNLNFSDWSRKQGYAISDIGHPLEDAHQAASELILPLLINKIQTS